ncbi:hypothetical protein [Paenibacillus sp. NRS-1780]|uniref:hypothetical protein n=1 Tax=Paenibacillus sp. NRS-1780 TaxID=3233904 RepID=UPI003D27F1D7
MSERIREIKERFAFNLKLAESTGFTGAEYKDIPYLLGFIDSLQQQVKELQEGNRSAVESREIAVRKARETSVTSNQHYAMAFELREQLAERDRTIEQLETVRDQLKTWLSECGTERDRLRKALEEAYSRFHSISELSESQFAADHSEAGMKAIAPLIGE